MCFYFEINVITGNDFICSAFGTLVPGAVLIPLRIATKLSMTKSERIFEN